MTSTMPGSSLMLGTASSFSQLSCEPEQCPLDGHARSVRGRLFQRSRELLVRQAEFDPAYDGFPVVTPEARERLLVALDAFTTDRRLERRRRGVLDPRLERDRFRPARNAADLAADPIQQRLTEVGLQCAIVPDFEPVQPFKRLE